MRSALDRDAMCLPEEEEVRMLRAITHGALHQAARNREYHASFRGFRIHALRRRVIPGFNDLLEVLVSVSFAGMLLERELVTTKISSEPEQMP